MGRTKISYRPADVSLRRVRDTKPKSEWTRAIQKVLKKHGSPLFLSKHFPDVIRTRNKWIEQVDLFGDDTLAEVSSVYEGGNGLYSLRAYERGDVLPFAYPGTRLTLDEHDELCTFLMECTHVDSWDPETINEAVERLNVWGIQLVQRNSLCAPYWDTLYDSFVAYRFATPTHMFFWPTYTWTGHIWAHKTSPGNAGIYINEPTHYSHFYNRIKEQVQLSCANVEPIIVDDQIRFRAIRKIRRWDEILMYYGPDYKRPYASYPVEGTFTAPGVLREQFNQLLHKLA